jgi:hypothetical protein
MQDLRRTSRPPQPIAYPALGDERQVLGVEAVPPAGPGNPPQERVRISGRQDELAARGQRIQKGADHSARVREMLDDVRRDDRVELCAGRKSGQALDDRRAGLSARKCGGPRVHFDTSAQEVRAEPLEQPSGVATEIE